MKRNILEQNDIEEEKRAKLHKVMQDVKIAIEMALIIKDGRSITEHEKYSEFIKAKHNGGSLARLIQVREELLVEAKEWEQDILEMLSKTIK